MVDRHGACGQEFDPPSEVNWPDVLPTGPAGQSCAFCGCDVVAWLHPLDQRLVRYRAYGKGYTLPHFWTVCAACEGLYAADDDAALLAVMTANRDGYRWRDAADVEELVRRPLEVFRRADLGARPLPPDALPQPEGGPATTS